MPSFSPRLARVALVATLIAHALSSPSCNCDDELQATLGSLRGVVCSTSTGGPVGGVVVTVVDGRGNTYSATTDAFGVYRLDRLGAGNGTVTVAEPNLLDRRYDVQIDPLLEAEVIDSTCHPAVGPPPPETGSISGCICDEAVGALVDGANVFVLTADGGVAVTGTDAAGCFVLDGVPIGAQTLKVERGVFFEEHEVSVVVDQTVTLPVVASCEPTLPPGDVGSVEGRVCAPDGVTWLSDADAFVVRSDGSRVGATTDADGRYYIDGVPVGAQVVEVVKGSFTASIPVTIFSGQTTVIPEGECQLAVEDLRIAVVTGDYDRVQDVLSGIGIGATQVDTYSSSFINSAWVEDLLGDRSLLFSYDIVFLNCGLGDLPFTAQGFFTRPISAETLQNLRDFAAQGGSVYASDWAYYVVEKTWPDFVSFYGDDAEGGSAKVGFAPQDVTANVVDAAMSIGLGQTSMILHYPLLSWVVMQDVSPLTTVYIKGSAELEDGTTLNDVPHTVAFRPGSGRVLFTSFHQEAGINPDMQRVLQLLIFEL